MIYVITVHWFASVGSSSRMEVELRQTLTITIRLANLTTTPKFTLAARVSRFKTYNEGKANSNLGWDISILCTYNIAGCPFSKIVIVVQKVHHFNLNPS